MFIKRKNVLSTRFRKYVSNFPLYIFPISRIRRNTISKNRLNYDIPERYT